MSQTISLDDAKTITYAWQDSSFGSKNSIATNGDIANMANILPAIQY